MAPESVVRTKNKGGRPKGSGKRSRAHKAAEGLLNLVADTLAKGGLPVFDGNGQPVMGENGKQMRRPPPAAWLGQARLILAECRAWEALAKDPKIAPGTQKTWMAATMERLREEGRLPSPPPAPEAPEANDAPDHKGPTPKPLPTPLQSAEDEHNALLAERDRLLQERSLIRNT
jgi:hypothetical protein